METLSINFAEKHKTTAKPQLQSEISSETVSILLDKARIEIESDTIFLETFQVSNNYSKGYVLLIETSPLEGDWNMTLSLDGNLIDLTQTQKQQIENQIYNYAIVA